MMSGSFWSICIATLCSPATAGEFATPTATNNRTAHQERRVHDAANRETGGMQRLDTWRTASGLRLEFRIPVEIVEPALVQVIRREQAAVGGEGLGRWPGWGSRG